jgi:type I restriction enzyme S subunit
MELKKGYKQTELGVIPEDWDLIKMSTIGDTLIGLTYSPINVKESGTLVLRSSNVQNMKLSFKDNVFVDMELPDRVIVKENDLLICVRNGSRQLIGKCALIDKQTSGSAFGAFMTIYRSKHNKFVFYQFQSNIIQEQINETLGATINQLTNRDLSVFKIFKPRNIVEETQITQALSDADAYITSLEKLIEKKKAIKQGAMQELLKPKDGWEIKKLVDICVIKKGQQLNKNTLTSDGDYPVMNGGIFSSGYTTQYNQNANTIIISEGGNSCGFVNFMKTKFWQGGHCYSVETPINHDFLYHNLKFKEKEIMSLRVGSGLPNIQLKRLYSFQIAIPNQETQIQIAEIFNSLDLEIKTLMKKLKKTKELKQSMMQNLLTGKIRLL